MDWSRWLFDPWSDWGLAFIAFAIGCLVLGHLSRPLVTVTASGVAAALLAITAALPLVPALALVVTPMSGGCAAASLRAGKIKPDLFLGTVLFPLTALFSVFVEHWLPTLAAGGIALALSKLAPRMSRPAVLVIGVLPTLGELLTLLFAPQVLDYKLPSVPAPSGSAIVGPLVTVSVAILGSMVWVKWREQQAERRNRRP